MWVTSDNTESHEEQIFQYFKEQKSHLWGILSCSFKRVTAAWVMQMGVATYAASNMGIKKKNVLKHLVDKKKTTHTMASSKHIQINKMYAGTEIQYRLLVSSLFVGHSVCFFSSVLF